MAYHKMKEAYHTVFHKDPDRKLVNIALIWPSYENAV